MKFFLLSLFILLLSGSCLKAQQNPAVQTYGTVSMADLILKGCEFEKGANAMVLLDKGEAVTELESVVIKYHQRIKIFNDAGKSQANIRLNYYSEDGLESIAAIEAQTINLVNDQIVITKIDPAQIYTERVDKYRKAIVFAFPNVRPGCIIEYKYTLHTQSPADFHGWNFQQDIPVRYSEFSALISAKTVYNFISKGYQPFVKDTSVAVTGLLGNTGRQCWWAKANVHSYVQEPFVSEGVINKQSISFQLRLLKSGMDYLRLKDTWGKIAGNIIFDPDFGAQLNENLREQDMIINKAKTFVTEDEKIAYLFTEVKKSMTWNKINAWYTDKGVQTAWSKKIGNSTEINLILYNLLKKSGIKVYPMLLSTRDNGVIEPSYGSFSRINITASYVQTADTNRYYVLDASSKNNFYNEVPAEFLNTYGVIIDPAKRDNITKIKFLQNETPAKEVIIIDCTISADGKLAGSLDVADYSYNKAFHERRHKSMSENEYVDYLLKPDNNFKVTKPVFENMEVDSLPFIQKFNFLQQLNDNDGQYIYFNPNLFTPLHTNPLINEQRYSDIDFGYCNAYSINGQYVLPIGYKINELPKSMVLYMPDKSITFKRVIGELNGRLQVHYNINFTRSLYTVAEYKALYRFYKQMFEMLNEPIVLKKE